MDGQPDSMRKPLGGARTPPETFQHMRRMDEEQRAPADYRRFLDVLAPFIENGGAGYASAHEAAAAAVAQLGTMGFPVPRP